MIQVKILKYGLGRLARLRPNENPREFLLEWLAQELHEYETHLKMVDRERIR